eukprot:2862372-Rhodomonas_salina.1
MSASSLLKLHVSPFAFTLESHSSLFTLHSFPKPSVICTEIAVSDPHSSLHRAVTTKHTVKAVRYPSLPSAGREGLGFVGSGSGVQRRGKGEGIRVTDIARVQCVKRAGHI